jgi:hypothetical protein
MPCSLEEVIDPTSIDYLTYVHNGYVRAKQVLDSDDMKASISVSEHEVVIQSYSIFHEDLLLRTERGLAALRKIRIPKYLHAIADAEAPLEDYIGLHIRRTDHVKCIAASPLPAFQAVVAENPGKKFFLATDDTAVKDLFGDSVVSPIRTLGRMTIEQQQMGVVDWLLLHKCKKIYASAGSSFSELAAWRAGIELVCV